VCVKHTYTNPVTYIKAFVSTPPERKVGDVCGHH
jgi:hypothetical protein